jgi:ADP-heptose:LPS heptosyltransferase
MKILALQLKRIGDAILTAPALAALRAMQPEARLTLAVHASCAPLLEMIPAVDAGIVFGPARGWTPWQQALTGGFDAVLDFTGTDRSAAACALTRAPLRATFAWVKKNRPRALAYHRFIDSAVRDFHTADHYEHLLRGLEEAHDQGGGAPPPRGPTGGEGAPAPGSLTVPTAARDEAHALLPAGDYVVLHPGSARPEKYWFPERWAEVAAHLHRKHVLPIVFTGGKDRYEQAHLAAIRAALRKDCPALDLSGRLSLGGFAATLARARLVVSCDTAAVHFAAAFRRPQIALFGPTNPFHWRPRHERAVVLSAAQPDAPLTAFDPHMKGAPMERISTGLVIGAMDSRVGFGDLAI